MDGFEDGVVGAEGGVHADARRHHAEAVRSDEVQVVLGGHVAQLSFARGPLAARLAEPGRDDDHVPDARLAGLSYGFHRDLRRDDDHREVRVCRADVGHTLDAQHLVVVRIDGHHRPVEVRDEVIHDGAAHGAFALGRADDGHCLGREQLG